MFETHIHGAARHRFQVGAVLAAVMLLATFFSPSATASSLSPQQSANLASAPHTLVVSVRPVNAHHHLAAGYHVRQVYLGTCNPGSEVAAAAYRCFTSHYVFDPCWAEGSPARSVLCLVKPWSTSVTRIKLSAHLAPLPPPVPVFEPWGLQLRINGGACVAIQGAHDQFKGRWVDYQCVAPSSRLVVLRGLNHSWPLWYAQTAIRTHSGYRMGTRIAILTAYYARP